jgi:hypothetical protein
MLFDGICTVRDPPTKPYHREFENLNSPPGNGVKISLSKSKEK